MAAENLHLFEERLRSFTEKFSVCQWTILYHQNTIPESFFFRRNNRTKVLVNHTDYPDFFATTLNIKQELTTSISKLNADTKLIIREMFSNTISSSNDALVGMLRIAKDQNHFATLIFGDKSTIAKNISKNHRTVIRVQEKKELLKITRILAEYFTEKNDYFSNQVQFRWGETVKPNIEENNNLTNLIVGVQQGLQASGFSLYWVTDDFYSLGGSGIVNTKISDLDAQRLVLKNNFDVNKKINVWNNKKIAIHSKIKTQLNPVLEHIHPTLWITIEFKEQIANKILGTTTNKRIKPCLVIEFIRSKNADNFNHLDFDFATVAYAALEKYFLDSTYVNDLAILIQHQIAQYSNLSNQSDSKYFSTKSNVKPLAYLSRINKNHQFEIAYAEKKFSLNHSLIRTKHNQDKNNYFYFGDITTLNKKEAFATQVGFDYFDQQVVDILDLQDQFTKFIKNIPKVTNYIFFDFSFNDETKHKKNNSIGLFGNGYTFFQYSFESGKLKKLADCQHRIVITLATKDLIIALPKLSVQSNQQKKINESLVTKLENELVIWGHSNTLDLSNNIGQIIAGSLPNFLLFRRITEKA